MTTNKWQDKQFEILIKLRNICDECAIPLFLSGETALAAYRDNVLSDYITVCVDSTNILKLIDAIKNKADGALCVDVVKASTNELRYSLHVFNPKTIDFTVSNYGKLANNCLRVVVEVIEHVPLPSRQKKLMNLKNTVNKGKNKLLRSVNSSEGRLLTTIPSDKGFLEYINIYSKSTDKRCIGDITFNRDTFANIEHVSIVGELFTVPGDIENYLKKVYGTNWALIKPEMYEETKLGFRDGDFSWDVYRNLIDGIINDDYYHNQKKSNKLRKEHSKYHNRIVKYYDILRRTDTRYKLWEKYEPNKDKIMELYNRGEFDTLNTMLSEYIEAITKFAGQGLGLCFDPDIFSVAKGVLIHNGQEDLAEYAENIIPEVHRNPLKLKDYKGNLIN